MGISADEFWRSSQNGKAMLAMLARRGDVEVVRDVCDWLSGEYGKDLEVSAIQKGATQEQARTLKQNAVGGLRSIVETMNDRNATQSSMSIVDSVFQRYYEAGKQRYDEAMLRFANELRRRIGD